MIRILVIDDVLIIRNFMTKTLEMAGYSVCAVSNGIQALEVVKNEKFSLAICDLNLPDLSGQQFVQKMLVDFPEMPCIILTGAATKESIQAMSKCDNLKAYLVKPLDRQRLLTEVQRYIND